MTRFHEWGLLLAVTIFSAAFSQSAVADLLNVVNPGFEDITGQSVFNEFTFGEPVGWSIYDPDNITPSTGVFTEP